MVYRRRGKFKFKRRRFRRGNSKYIRRQVKGVLRREAETKFKVQNFNSNISNASPFEQECITPITIGTGNDQRIGNQITVLKLGFDLSITYNGQTENTSDTAYVRVLWVFPRKGNTTGSLKSQMTATNPGVFGRPDPDQMICLYDQRFLLTKRNDVSGPGAGMLHRRCKYFKFFKYMKCNYTEGANVENEPILYITTDALAGSNFINIGGTVSCSFKDM